MNNFEGTVIFLLLSSHVQQKNQIPNIDSFRAIINDTQVSYDPDECGDDLSSTVDETLSLFVGPSQSNLMSISSLSHISAISI